MPQSCCCKGMDVDRVTTVLAYCETFSVVVFLHVAHLFLSGQPVSLLGTPLGIVQ